MLIITITITIIIAIIAIKIEKEKKTMGEKYLEVSRIKELGITCAAFLISIEVSIAIVILMVTLCLIILSLIKGSDVSGLIKNVNMPNITVIIFIFTVILHIFKTT